MSNEFIEQQTSGHPPVQGRTHSTSNQNMSNLQHQSSANSNRLSRTTSHGSSQGQNDSETGSRPSIAAQEGKRPSARPHSLSKQETYQRSDAPFYLEHTYSDLNPWYGTRPKNPIFGMNGPFPRTVRPGMLWGRGRNRTYQNSSGRGKEKRGAGSHGEDRSIRPIPVAEWEDVPTIPFPTEPRRQYSVSEAVLPNSSHDNNIPGASESYLTPVQAQPVPGYTLRYPGRLSPLEETQWDDETVQASPTKEETKESQEASYEDQQDNNNEHRNSLARLRAKYPEARAEFLSTMIYIFFGVTGTLYARTLPGAETDYQTRAWAWGFSVMAGIYVAGGISGAHMSPWVSVCFAVFRGFPWKMVAVYSIAQILGGLAAGALAWAIYRDGIKHADPQLTENVTGMAFYSFPSPDVSLWTAFWNSFVSAAMYICIAFGVGDDSNTPPGSGMSALIYGLLNYMLTITMGYNGLGTSPARDLGPRFIAWWAGYGSKTFSTGWWSLGPILAGLTGSLTGGLVYDVFVFSGNESPVNYSWPSITDIRNKWKEKVKQETDTLPV